MNMKKTLITCIGICITAASLYAERYEEALFDDWAQTLEKQETLYYEKTDCQEMEIFSNKEFGKVLTLDSILQTTTRDEFVYHEMMTHIPIFSHGNVKKVLIIGGGDGGTLRETLKHKGIEQVTMVEIDRSVVELSRKHLPELSAGAFDDSRTNLIIGDGFAFVRDTDEKFDVIICDSPDPIGPAACLFTREFFVNCKKALQPDGIFIAQNGVPFVQPDEVMNTYDRKKGLFAINTYYVAPVPTYIGGFMTFAFATDNQNAIDVCNCLINERVEESGIKFKYYNPMMHNASFCLPQYVINLLNQ